MSNFLKRSRKVDSLLFNELNYELQFVHSAEASPPLTSNQTEECFSGRLEEGGVALGFAHLHKLTSTEELMNS